MTKNSRRVVVEEAPTLEKPRDLRSTGDAAEALDAPEVEVLERPSIDKDYADELAFMEEPVEVMVMESPDKNAEPVVHVACNGRNQFFPRGQWVTVKRKFVGILAAARTVRYSQEEYTNGAGERAIRNVPHAAPAYPFQVRGDSAKGSEWLKKALGQ